jgi:undecaprenyl-diphosphatase
MEITSLLEYVKSFGEIGLFFYSIFETITPLAGVELILIPFINEFNFPWWRLSLNITVANTIGSAIVYYFMAKENNFIVKKFIKPETRQKAERIFKKYGHWAIFIFAMTPLPYFVIVFVASFARMNLKTLLLSTIFSRGLRFTVTTLIIHFFQGVNTLQLILILIGISLPIMAIMYMAEKRISKQLDN